MLPWLAILLALWLLWAIAARRILDNPWQTVRHGLIWPLGLAYVRLVHNLRVRGNADLLADPPAGPLLIVANHTAGIDPILIQARCARPVRWIMAEDMKEPRLNWAWNLFDIIFVDRSERKAQALRDAIRHLQSGGAVGIFPEGSLERPPRRLLPFQAGVGWLIKRTGAKVLPVVVRGTPHANPAWASLWRTSNSSIEIGELLDFTNPGREPSEIVDALQSTFVAMTGWDIAEPPSEPRA